MTIGSSVAGGSPHMRVTLLVVYIRVVLSLSPFASTIGFDLIGSNFYTPHLPSSLIPLLSLYENRAVPKWKWQNWGIFWKTSVSPMNIHEMRSALQRKKRQNFFQSCLELQYTSKQGPSESNMSGCRIKWVPETKYWETMRGLPVTAGCLLLASGGGGGALIAKLVPLRASAAWVSAVATFSPARPC